MTEQEAEIVALFHDAIMFDLETGSHELNNQLSIEFNKKHPKLLQTLVKLRTEAMQVLPDRFTF